MLIVDAYEPRTIPMLFLEYKLCANSCVLWSFAHAKEDRKTENRDRKSERNLSSPPSNAQLTTTNRPEFPEVYYLIRINKFQRVYSYAQKIFKFQGG